MRNGTRKGRNGQRRQNWVCWTETGGVRSLCYSTLHPDRPYSGQNGKAKDPDKRPQFKRLKKAKRYFITTAQNATPVHAQFMSAIENFCTYYGAELVVLPVRYKNATSIWTESQQNEEYWNVDPKFLFNQRKALNSNLLLMGDIPVQPTAADPLTGMDQLTRGESGIFPHTKIRLKCVATPQGKMPKILTTTGACTVPNYTETATGKKGEFHHVLGGLVVEIENDKLFYLHNIYARSDGAFIFKDRAFYPDRVEEAPPYQVIAFGDAHYRFADPAVVKATFGAAGLVETLDPLKQATLVWHDLLDGYAVNPHHKGNPLISIAKQRHGFDDVEKEVNETIDWLLKCNAGRTGYIVASNHDDMLSRWIMSADWKTDPLNAEFYLKTALHMAMSAKMGDTGAEYLDPFAFWVNARGHDNIHPLARSESLVIGGVAFDYHGDRGPGGARGTVKNLSRIGVKVMSGHGHSPEIELGHTRLGTMTRLEAEYTKGSPGAWLNAHGSLDGFDKRHLHFCINGKFWL